MSIRRLFLFLFVAVAFLIATGIPTKSQNSDQSATTTTTSNSNLIVGPNVNMVTGTTFAEGDPWLQRQNEPSIAVSTRNPLHLLAGANDYRTVSWPITGETLPGLPEGATAANDAWLGVFKSYDGGQSWKSTLLPGYHQYDTTPLGDPTSRLLEFHAATDPTVRAGTNGLFYYSGVAFERIENGLSAVFVARFIDNNIEGTDSIKYIDTEIIDEGTSGQFTDKPWIAVDIPRDGGVETIDGQQIPCGNVYIAYSVFTGDLEKNVASKIMLSKSTDCGDTWSRPIKISESHHINQGTTIAIDPRNGTIYIAWRRFGSPSESGTILVSKSIQGGRRFSKPVEVKRLEPYPPGLPSGFDQSTTSSSFRTNSFPTLAVDDKGVVYLAWTQRGEDTEFPLDTRIVIATSTNGTNWSDPVPVETPIIKDPINYPEVHSPGHQFMPALTFAAGKLMMIWYDQRDDIAECEQYEHTEWINEICPNRHTTDVRAAQIDPGLKPKFNPSVRVSRYMYFMEEIYGSNPPQFWAFQGQYNYVNLQLFEHGSKPFHGDYIDITPSPMFLPDGNGGWRFNTRSDDPCVFHATWTDNRDVTFPPGSIEEQDWINYLPPNSEENEGEREAPDCGAPGWLSGIRNQNIYTASISPGLIVGSPGNDKPLTLIDPVTGKLVKRTFIVTVKNNTAGLKYFDLEIIPPFGVLFASFHQFDPVNPIRVTIEPFSSISTTVFIESEFDPDEPIKVEVREVLGTLQDFIFLNPDDTNPDPVGDILSVEVHNPNIVNPNIVNPNIVNPNIVNPNIVNTELVNPNIVNPNIVNPNIVNPNIVNPNIVNPNIVNPNIVNPNIVNSSITGAEWDVTNDGNTTSTYTFQAFSNFDIPVYDPNDPNSLLPDEAIGVQLIIYQVHTTPAADKEVPCTLVKAEYHEVIANITTPNIVNPGVSNSNSDMSDPTFSLPPGGEAKIFLLIYDPDTTDDINFFPFAPTGDPEIPFDPEDPNVAGGVIQDAVNSNDEAIGVTTPPVVGSLLIRTTTLPDGVVGQGYSATLEVFGGTPAYSWIVFEGLLHPDLQLTDGVIQNNPAIPGSPTTAGEYNFTVQVIDSSAPPKSDKQDLVIRIAEPLVIETTTLPCGTMGETYSEPIIVSGGIEPYTWTIEENLPEGLSFDPETRVISGTPSAEGDYDFTVQVVDSASPHQEATQPLIIQISDPPMITTAWLPHGIVDSPYNSVQLLATGVVGDLTWSFVSGDFPSCLNFTTNGVISSEDKIPLGCAGTYQFTVKLEDSCTPPRHDTKELVIVITAHYTDGIKLARYDGGSGDDEATALGVDNSGNVYVTGKSKGDGTGFDYATVKYDERLSETWPVRYLGGYGDDEATAIAVNSSGIYVTGRSKGSSRKAGFDYATIKYNSNGVPVWIPSDDVIDDNGAARHDRGYGDDVAAAISTDSVVDSSGDVYVTGYSRGKTTGKDFYTIKYKSDGVPLWEATYDGPAHKGDIATAIAVDSSGYVYVTGYSYRGMKWEHSDYCTVKYNADDGKLVWAKRYDSRRNGNDEPTAIAVDEMGNVYVTGRSEESLEDEEIKTYDYFTLMYNSSGKMQWEKRYEGSGIGHDEATDIAVEYKSTEEVYVYVTGRSDGGDPLTGGSEFDYYTVKYNALNGEIVWEARYYGLAGGNNEATAISLDESGNVYVTGRSYGGSDRKFDYETIMYNNLGHLVWIANYNGLGNGDDEASDIAVFENSLGVYVYVTGRSKGNGTSSDYATVRYIYIKPSE